MVGEAREPPLQAEHGRAVRSGAERRRSSSVRRAGFADAARPAADAARHVGGEPRAVGGEAARRACRHAPSRAALDELPAAVAETTRCSLTPVDGFACTTRWAGANSVFAIEAGCRSTGRTPSVTGALDEPSAATRVSGPACSALKVPAKLPSATTAVRATVVLPIVNEIASPGTAGATVPRSGRAAVVDLARRHVQRDLARERRGQRRSHTRSPPRAPHRVVSRRFPRLRSGRLSYRCRERASGRRPGCRRCRSRPRSRRRPGPDGSYRRARSSSGSWSSWGWLASSAWTSVSSCSRTRTSCPADAVVFEEGVVVLTLRRRRLHGRLGDLFLAFFFLAIDEALVP